MSGQIVTTQALESESAVELAAIITQSKGPFLKLSEVSQILGYPTPDAARKAARKRTPIEAIDLPNRRGRFVRTVDFVDWLFRSITRSGTLIRHPDSESIGG